MFRNRRISVLLVIFALIFCFSIAGSASAVSVPVANFTSNVTNGSAPLTVQYTDTSAGSPTSWNWNFGDGQSSTVENPTHTYSEVGNYNVTLNVTNSAGSSSLTQSNYVSTGSSVITNNNGIDIYVANSAGVKYNMPNGVTTAAQYGGVYPYVPNTYYIAEGGGGTNPIQLSTDPTNKVGQFTTTTNQTGTFYVVFSGGIGHLDDGILMLAVNGTLPSDFSVTLQSSGYTYTLPAPAITNPSTSSLTNITYVNDALNETFNSSDFIYGTQSWKPANTANYPIFNGENMTSASSQFHLMFIDLDVGGFVTNAIANEINDGSITVHYTFNNLPSTSFASFGAYGWFSACNWGTGIPQYSNSAQDGFNVEGLPVVTPVANFTANTTSGNAPETVQFTDTSSNSPTTWNWDFGDGGSSTLQNPTYTYTTPGTYNVTLTSGNSAGNNTIVESNLINVGNYLAPVSGFTENTTSGLNPLNVQFNDQSTGTITSYYWTFGDGGSSTLQDPSYTYNTPGTYTVTETVSGPGGNNTAIQTNVITVFNSTPPNVTATPDSGIYNSTQNVVLSSDQPGSIIYYTTDGSNPENSSTSVPYSAPIPISNTTNLQFAAVNQGGVWSARYSKTYTIDTLSPTASSNLNGGTYNTTQTVTLNSNDQNAVIYYTEDTTNPTTSNTAILYTGPISISSTTTLRYAALNPFGVWSSEYTVNYVIGNGGLENSAWPKSLDNLGNTGQSPNVGPQTNVTEWVYNTKGIIYYGSPTISANGTIYIGSTSGFYAINPNGTLQWSFSTGSVYGNAPISSNGTIYVGCFSGNLDALNPNGTLLWTYPTGSYIEGSPVIGPDGTIYVGSYNDNLYAINPNGTLKWKYNTGGQLFCYEGMAIGSDGTIYVGSLNGKLYAINPDGTLQWTYSTGNDIYGAPAVGANGTIYVGSYNNYLYALNPNGTLLWSYYTGSGIRGSPTIGTNGTIYVGTLGYNLDAINPNGTLQWNYTATNDIYGSPVIGADGTIYFGTMGDYVYALATNGTLIWSYNTGNRIYGLPAIGTNGTLYIGGYNDNLYAFKDLQPIASFSSSQTTGGVPVTIQFNDTSLYASSWFWNFGDGTNSTLQNPSHVYTTPGNYYVSETVTNAMGNSTITTPITLSGIPPVVNFTASTTSGSFPLTVSFTDQSQYDTSWLWNFGDGTTSTAQDPTHTYLAIGNYTVSLTAINSFGNSTLTNAGYIQANSIITNYQGMYLFMSNHNGTAYFDGGPANSYNFVAGGNNQLHITNNPVTSPSGQVNTSTSQSGEFYITTTGGRGSNDDLILLVAVKGPIPSNFSLNLVSSGYVWTPGSPNTNDYVTGALNETFTASDFLYGPQSLMPDSSGMNVIYNGENSSNPSSAEYLMFVDLYVGNLNTASINNGAAMVQYTFSNLTTQASFDTYAWATGYDVKWANLPTSSGYNVIPTPTANFTANTTSGSDPLNVQFTDTSSNNPTSWLWNFGDGGSSTLQNPTYTYNTPGTYTVSLTATNADGNNTFTETNLINVIGPVADNTTGLTYNSIEAAVNAANNGDTILVSAGNYVENIILNKTLTLEALGQVNVTPQDPTQPVFTINSNGSGSTIEGFNISGSDNSGIYINNATGNTITNDAILGNGTMTWGICVLNSNGTNNINNNIVNNCTEGINLYNVDGATITNNAATDNEYDGIALTNSNDNTITNNNGTTQNVSGIRLNSSNDNTVANNNLTGNIWTSISLVTSQFNQITNNTASNDQEGMYLYSSDNNTVSGNTAYNNVWDGIAVAESNNNVIQDNDNVTNNNSGIRIIGASSGNQVLNNVVTGNVWADMSLDTAGNTTISGNTFTNSEEGIFIYNSNGNTLTNNTMNNDIWDGIYIGNSDNNTLTGNSMSNGGYGVRIQGSTGNSIVANNFVNNYDQAYDDGSNETWNNSTTGNYYNDWNSINPRPVDGGSNIDQHPTTTPN